MRALYCITSVNITLDDSLWWCHVVLVCSMCEYVDVTCLKVWWHLIEQLDDPAFSVERTGEGYRMLVGVFLEARDTSSGGSHIECIIIYIYIIYIYIYHILNYIYIYTIWTKHIYITYFSETWYNILQCQKKVTIECSRKNETL